MGSGALVLYDRIRHVTPGFIPYASHSHVRYKDGCTFLLPLQPSPNNGYYPILLTLLLNYEDEFTMISTLPLYRSNTYFTPLSERAFRAPTLPRHVTNELRAITYRKCQKYDDRLNIYHARAFCSSRTYKNN